MSLLACGRGQETSNSVIAEDRNLFDAVISEAKPNDFDFKGPMANIGFDDAGLETRMLLSFPEIMGLYREDVVLSSIANISIEVKTIDVQVNPENIHLYVMTTPWSPYVSWNSRVSFLEGYEWQSAGGDLGTFGPFYPDISKTEGAELTYKTLTFNVTSSIIELMAMGETIAGAIILVGASPVNDQDFITLYTSNHSVHAAKPRAILVFNQEGIFR